MINIINNVKDFFKEINFNEETHTYTKDKKRLTPVSYVLKNFVEEFDSDKISGLVAIKRGVSQSVILQEWEDNKNRACELGTSVHLFGEKYCRDCT